MQPKSFFKFNILELEHVIEQENEEEDSVYAQSGIIDRQKHNQIKEEDGNDYDSSQNEEIDEEEHEENSYES